MILAGFLVGIVLGATPGLAGPMAIAISLPILISTFGYHPDALLPVMGFLVNIMKGVTEGGAVPAILLNTPGTPDAFMATLDGYPMSQQGQAKKALRLAHLSSASGDAFSDIILFICAPFLAILVESYLNLPGKTALLILALSFIAADIVGSPAKELISTGSRLLAVFIPNIRCSALIGIGIGALIGLWLWLWGLYFMQRVDRGEFIDFKKTLMILADMANALR